MVQEDIQCSVRRSDLDRAEPLLPRYAQVAPGPVDRLRLAEPPGEVQRLLAIRALPQDEVQSLGLQGTEVEVNLIGGASFHAGLHGPG